jgi:hypothetical protein
MQRVEAYRAPQQLAAIAMKLNSPGSKFSSEKVGGNEIKDQSFFFGAAECKFYLPSATVGGRNNGLKWMSESNYRFSGPGVRTPVYPPTFSAEKVLLSCKKAVIVCLGEQNVGTRISVKRARQRRYSAKTV